MMAEHQLPQPLVNESRAWSAIWLLPLIALLIGGWLLYKTLREAPLDIMIAFPTGSGIEVGKTRVLYEGVAVGLVADMRLDETDWQGVQVRVEMDARVANLLADDSQFWLVKPEISFQGVTGLETIVSGNYIGFKPGKGKQQGSVFEASSGPPDYDSQLPGLHIQLQAASLGSLHKNSPLLYRDIPVGRVLGYRLDSAQQISLQVHVEPEYAELIRAGSRFWNISGFQADIDLSGVVLRADSMLSLLQGGIAFEPGALTAANPPAEDGARYPLYESQQQAQPGIYAEISFPSTSAIQPGKTKVRMNGLDVGTVMGLTPQPLQQRLVAQIMFDPEVAAYLTSGSRFWLVKPELSVYAVKGLDTLLGGRYIQMSPGEGEPSRQWQALSGPPAVDYSSPGLHLKLVSEEMHSVRPGAPVYYRQTQVGEVKAVALDSAGRSVTAELTIDPDYAGLVNDRSRFWNASGVTLSGSLTEVKVAAQSLLSLVQGGVAFSTPDTDQPAKPVANGHRFQLYKTQEKAEEKGTQIRLQLPGADGVAEGTPVKYRGFVVGEVQAVALAEDLSAVTASIALWDQSDRFAVAGTRFWLVKPQVQFDRVEHLDTLVMGNYFGVEPGEGEAQYDFVLVPAPKAKRNKPGVNLVLRTPSLNSIREGLKITYRDIAVGEVTGFELAPEANEVLVYINIRPPYHKLVRQGSQFWNSSGLSIDIGLFKGAKIRSESLESVVLGGIAFACPDGAAEQPLAEDGRQFKLYSEPQPQWLQWQPKIPLWD